MELTISDMIDIGTEIDFLGTVDFLVEKCAQPVLDLRHAVFRPGAVSDLSVYWNPATEKVGVFVESDPDIDEFLTCQELATEKLGESCVQATPLTNDDLLDGWWVKIAHSSPFGATRRPSVFGRPVAAMVAEGLLGSGLGYGIGKIAAIDVPGLGHRLPGPLRLDGSLGSTGDFVGYPTEIVPRSRFSRTFKSAVDAYVKTASEGDLGTMSGPSFEEMPLIRMDDMGRVLWGSNADPRTTAMTVGALYGAGQMPDPNAVPGAVTPHQVGLFGTAMGAAGGGLKGYLTGRAVGYGLSALTGMTPSTQRMLGQAGATLGVLQAIVPKLFQ